MCAINLANVCVNVKTRLWHDRIAALPTDYGRPLEFGWFAEPDARATPEILPPRRWLPLRAGNRADGIRMLTSVRPDGAFVTAVDGLAAGDPSGERGSHDLAPGANPLR